MGPDRREGQGCGPSRRALLGAPLALGALGALACARGPRSSARRPARGVVLLVADDLGRGDLALLGNAGLATPALDGLGRAGAVLERAYTPTALCRPSRAALASGLWPHATGRSWYGELADEVVLWPQRFQPAGIVSGTFGKTAVAGNRELWAYCEGGKLGYRPGRDPASFRAATDEFLGLTGDRPFTFVVNFYDPHRSDAALRDDPSRKSATQGELRRVEVPRWLPDLDELRLELRNYGRDVERLDACVAAVLDALDERRLTDDTLVVFLSDNGADLPFAKGTLYEAGVRLPCLARWPAAIPANTRHTALISFVDVLPTCMQALGLEPPADVDGRSFLSLLTGEREGHEPVLAHRERVFCEQDEVRGDAEESAAPSRAVIEPRYKYVRHFHLDRRYENASMRTFAWRALAEAARTDVALEERMRRLVAPPRVELFDLEADPFELANRAGDPALAEVETALGERLRGWLRAEGDPYADDWEG